jgi:ankyrin repeat protein
MQELFEAIKAGDAARTAALLDADPSLLEAKDERGLSPLTVAVYHRQAAVVEMLESRGALLDVFTAAMTGRTDRLQELIEGNRSLTRAYSHDGWTALHLAAFFGHTAAAAALLAKGAEVKARSTNPMQNTPLHAAAAGRQMDLVKLLIDHGADVNARQHGGWTALHAAAQSGDAALVQMLLENGADVSARADNNQSALDLALTKGHQQVVDLLENRGASLAPETLRQTESS